MRPNTSASGIFSTKRSSAVSVSVLTRMLVPKPKKAFQSPGTQSFGRNDAGDIADAVDAITRALQWTCRGRRQGEPSRFEMQGTRQSGFGYSPHRLRTRRACVEKS